MFDHKGLHARSMLREKASMYIATSSDYQRLQFELRQYLDKELFEYLGEDNPTTIQQRQNIVNEVIEECFG